MTMLAKARTNRLNAIVARLDRLDLPMIAPLPEFQSRRRTA